MSEELIQTLLSKRDGYEEELRWHKFQLDAYSGCGGFDGKEKQPLSSFWGAGADAYAGGIGAESGDEGALDTYLDRFPREDLAKFKTRVGMANYPNPVEPIVDIRLSYLNRKPMTRNGIDLLAKGDAPWIQNVDGKGTPWESMMKDIVQIRAEVLGWCPVLFDVPEGPESLSVGEARALGIRPRMLPLFPANLYDWQETDDRIEWIKVVTEWTERESPFSKQVKVQRVAVWATNYVHTFDIVDVNGRQTLRSENLRPNPWGEIPIVICKHKPAPTDTVRGLSLVGGLARQGKKLLNYLSELDEHLRGSVFAILQCPTDNPANLSVIQTGTGSALPISTESSQPYKFISPESSVAEVYEKRIEATFAAIGRMGRTEQGSGKESGGQAKSGLSRAFEFQNLNQAIADVASQFGMFEQKVLRLVAKMEGASEAEIQAIRVVPPTRFDVEEMSKEIEEVLSALSLKLGPTATAEMKRRLVRKLLPNLEEKVAGKIDEEIDQESLEEEQARQLGRESLTSASDANNALDDEGEAEDQAEAA